MHEIAGFSGRIEGAKFGYATDQGERFVIQLDSFEGGGVVEHNSETDLGVLPDRR